MPLSVPQSSSVTTRSWATSTSRRVRYPELAVLSAVSARPFRAPWVEMKYCITFNPSRKFAVIGVSIIEPSGLVMRPRIPESCLICAGLPRAPESAYIHTLLKELCSSSSPSRFLTVSLDKLSIMAAPTISLARVQISITLLYFSPWVTRPEANWDSISRISSSASAIISAFSSGITKSSTPMDAPERVEYSYPRYISWSAKITVSFKPTDR